MPEKEADDLNFQPLWDYVLIDPIIQTTTPGGLALPEGARTDDLKGGLVVRAGKGAYRESGAFIENPIKVGDTVYFMGKMMPFVITLNRKKYLCMAGRDVVAIAERKEEVT